MNILKLFLSIIIFHHSIADEYMSYALKLA